MNSSLVCWFWILSNKQISYSRADTLYHPPCSRSSIDVLLDNDGGSLTIGYGSGGSSLLIHPQIAKGSHFWRYLSLLAPWTHSMTPSHFTWPNTCLTISQAPGRQSPPGWSTVLLNAKRSSQCPATPQKSYNWQAARETIDDNKINTNPVNSCLINQKPCALRSLVPNDCHENSASPLDLSKWSASWAKTLHQLLPLDKAFW